MKIIITILILLCLKALTFYAQTNSTTLNTSRSNNMPTFFLNYAFSGLGSNMGSFQPRIKINGTDFIYTYEQNSYWGEKNKKVDTVCVKNFRESSIDSIVEIIKDLKDTTIHKFNACIMSGGIHFMTITNGIDTTKFNLRNTFDYTALKIANILNQYTPTDKKLWANEEMIKDAEDCWANMMKRIDKDKKKKKLAINKKNTT